MYFKNINNMTLEEQILKEDEKDEEDKSEEKEESSEETQKSFDEALIDTLSTLTEHVKSLSDGQQEIAERIDSLEKSGNLGESEEKTELNIKPAESDEEDIGADVTVPDEYQSNSRQTGLDSDRSNNDGEKSPEDDESNLKMQDKAAPTQIQKKNFDFTTETPRPNAALETVAKSGEKELNMVLKDARTEGFDGLNVVAQNILSGKYYTPSEEEAWF